MGFERLVSVLQDKMSNYDTDMFQYLFDAIRERTGAREYTGKYGLEDADGVDTAYRVLADHVRTLTFAMSDGGMPDKDARGYVLRRILRRAIRYAHEKLHAPLHFFPELVRVVVARMSGTFPEITRKVDEIIEVLKDEETQFMRTLDRGIKLFNNVAEKAKQNGETVIKGSDAFTLYDTYGFPRDLTEMMAAEKYVSHIYCVGGV